MYVSDHSIAREYLSRGSTVVWFDISAEMIKSAKSKLRRSEVAAEFVRGDSEILPFKTGVFSIASCFDAFPDFPHSLECLTEMKRVLNSAGVLLLEQTKNLSLIGAFLMGGRRFHGLLRRLFRRKKSRGFAWFDECTRYEYPTTIFGWLRCLSLSFRIIGVNIVPSLPCEKLLRLNCNIEKRLEKSVIVNALDYRLVFICMSGLRKAEQNDYILFRAC